MNVLPRDAVRIVDLPALLPGNPSLATVRRWARSGIAGERLPSFKLGGRRYVDGLHAVEQWRQRCEMAAQPPPPARKRKTTVGARQKQIREAEALLSRDGI